MMNAVTVNAVDEVISFIKSNTVKNAEDLLYDSNTAKDVIIKWIQHIMRQSQQNKAKLDALDILTESTAFWICVYCQKALPIKFREGQYSYFEKKRYDTYVDLFFMKPQTDSKTYLL